MVKCFPAVAMKKSVRCCQHGGSVKDDEVIAECDKSGNVMASTDERCFRHF